jgi:hypothetical protein
MRGGRRCREQKMLLLGRGGGIVVSLDSYRVQLEKFLVRYDSECHLNSCSPKFPLSLCFRWTRILEKEDRVSA